MEALFERPPHRYTPRGCWGDAVGTAPTWQSPIEISGHTPALSGFAAGTKALRRTDAVLMPISRSLPCRATAAGAVAAPFRRLFCCREGVIARAAALSVLGPCVQYQSAQGVVRAVDDVSFDPEPGEIVVAGNRPQQVHARQGDHACSAPTSDGRVFLDGDDVTRMQAGALKASRKSMQMIFQDPYGSLNPRHDVGTIVGNRSASPAGRA